SRAAATGRGSRRPATGSGWTRSRGTGRLLDRRHHQVADLRPGRGAGDVHLLAVHQERRRTDDLLLVGLRADLADEAGVLARRQSLVEGLRVRHAGVLRELLEKDAGVPDT